MKKLLAILLSLILTFSCFSILGTATALAEEKQQAGDILMTSDFSSSTKWVRSNTSKVTYKDEDSDGVNDYCNFNIGDTTTGTAYIYSEPVTLVPGNQYEFSFYARVPSGSASYVTDTAKLYPKVAIYQPNVNSETGKVTIGHSEGKNEYCYSGNGDTTIIRRTAFTWDWTIGDSAPYTVNNYSIFGSQHYTICNDISPNEVYANWVKLTATFTAIDDDNNNGDQVVAFSIGLPKGIANLQLDIKDAQLKCTVGNYGTKTIMTSDFEDSTTTKWQSCKGSLTNISYNSEVTTDGTDYYARVNNTSTGFLSVPFELVPGNEYELTFDIRIPEESKNYLIGGSTFYAPNFMLYETTASATSGKATSKAQYSGDSQNIYAKDTRRSAFTAEWKIGDYGVINRTGDSTLLYGNQKNLLGSTTDVKTAYADWTTITAKFTAVADEEGETSQTVALAFNFIDLSSSATDYLLDIKDVVLKEYGDVTDEPEIPEEPEITVRGPEFTENFEDFAVGTKLYDHTLTGTQNMYSYSSKAELLTTFGSLEVVSGGHTGSNSLKGSTYYQYAAMPLNLTPNTKYELSFWYAYTTSDTDRYLNEITYGLYVPDSTNKKMTLASGKAGMFENSKVFAPNNSVAGIWRKATLKFTTGDNVDNLVFAYTYHDKLKSDISATVNKCPLYIDDVSIKCAENVAPKAEIAVDTKDAASIQFIGGYFKDFAVGDEVEFAVRTMDELVPVVSANGTTLTADSNGNYSFVALEENVIKVECDGDETRFDPNVDKYGRPLYEYNEVIAATPIWEGDTVYHETVLFIPGRETAKLLYPIDKVISVRSYDLTMNYLEGVDYEITEDGLLKILEGSKIPVFAKPLETTESNSFPVYGKEDTYAAFISDYDYPAYAIAITYEHTEQWPNDEGYNPETIIQSQKDKIPEVFKKLENGEEVNIVVFGDSASCGASTSGQFYDHAIYSKTGSLMSNILNFAPFTPAWPVMLEQNLKKLYPDAKITFKNIALGGQTAKWGKDVIKERLGYLERDAGWTNTTPDLMILGFGGNDLTAGHTAEEFGANMQSIIDEFRDYTGTDTEVLLWTEYAPNTSVVQYQPENLKANREQCYSLAENNVGVGLVDSMSVFFEVLESKEIYDIFNDNMVHGNDFLTRIIAQCLIAGLSEPEYLAGDINGDEASNLKDLVTLAQYVAKWENLTVNQAALDVDGNGVIDLNDVTHFAQYLAGWEGIEIY